MLEELEKALWPTVPGLKQILHHQGRESIAYEKVTGSIQMNESDGLDYL